MTEAVTAMRSAFAQLARGDAELPARIAVPVPEAGGVTLVMPGRGTGPFELGAKLVSVFPGNARLGLPLIHGAVVLFDRQTGEPAALLDGTALTALRTGAASGLATDLLALPQASAAAILGAGAQAEAQVEAMAAVRRLDVVRIYSRTKARAEALGERAAALLGAGARVEVAPSAQEAVRDVEIVCTATTAETPLIGVPDLAPGTHVNAVGSFRRGMLELDPAVLAQARLVVDHRPAALAEAGEVIAALEAGLITEADLVELGEVVLGRAVRRAPSEITVFKSVGVAIQDLVAGAAALARASALGLGTEVAL